MVPITSLWLPILIASVFVFFASFLVWTVFPWHRSDYKAVPNEEGARKALEGIQTGQYNIPNLPSRSDLAKPEFAKKFEEGPVGFLTILPSGVPSMGKSLVQWFLYSLIIGVMAAYLAGRVLSPGTDYRTVFRVTGTVAWLAYGFASIPDAIWFGRPWGMVSKQLVDALLYALLTAGTFGWLWPGDA